MALIYYRKKDQCKIKSPILHILQTTAASSVNFLYHLSVVHKMFIVQAKDQDETFNTKDQELKNDSKQSRDETIYIPGFK